MITLDGQITKHFNLAEFKCKGSGEVILNADVIAHIQRLEKFRKWYGRVMYVSSGYRSPEYNKKVGGASKSMHLKGLASDIALDMQEFNKYTTKRQNEYLDNVKNKWFELCKADGLNGGVGFYNTFFHLDSRKDKAFWDKR